MTTKLPRAQGLPTTYATRCFDGQAFVLQELYSGDLERALPGLSLPDKFKIASDCLTGLSTLHEEHWVHRDLKTTNILIRRSSEGRIDKVAVSDFDFMEREYQIEGNPGSFYLGSPYFAAPEKCAGQNETRKSDIWSMGMIFYHLFENLLQDGFKEKIKELMDMNEDDAMNFLGQKCIRQEEWLPEPKDKQSVDHLIWRMLQNKPETRISASAALIQLSSAQGHLSE